MSRLARERHEAAKRRKLQDEYVIDLDAELDSDNEYLPRPVDDKSSIPKVPEKPVPKADPVSTPNDKPKGPRIRQTPRRPTIDPFLDGVSKKDKAILTELKPLVLKYDCKDRLMKAIDNFRTCAARSKALENWTASCAMLKAKKN